jgi:hypothetical protein
METMTDAERLVEMAKDFEGAQRWHSGTPDCIVSHIHISDEYARAAASLLREIADRINAKDAEGE